jgi:hypothetical protein
MIGFTRTRKCNESKAKQSKALQWQFGKPVRVGTAGGGLEVNVAGKATGKDADPTRRLY